MSKTLEKSKIPKGYIFQNQINPNQVIKVKMIFGYEPLGINITMMDIYLEEFHLVRTALNNLFVDLSGRAGDFELLFSTKIGIYKYNGSDYYSEYENIIIPDYFQYVSYVIGLNNFPKFNHHITPRKYVGPKSYTPIQIAELYDFPIFYRGSNRTIVLIELGGGFYQSDLDYYFLEYLQLDNNPTVYVQPINGGSNNPADSENILGVTADIEICGAVAKCANIVVYFTPNNDIGYYDAFYYAMSNYNYYPTCFALTWGCAEAINNLSFMKSMDNLFRIANKSNITVFCASGDNASKDQLKGQNVDFPASSPNAISCGGSVITVANGVITKEVAWSYSGGGFSDVFPKPNYQLLLGSTRGVPDIAGNASPYNGYQIYANKKVEIVGGTGCVASLYSALNVIISSVKGSVSFLNDIVYPNASTVCYDITEGSNGPDGKYNAGIGWDPVTGNGRIYGDKLLELVLQ